jgi:RNA polymerase sigma-70 factor (ECF subfamily)
MVIDPLTPNVPDSRRAEAPNSFCDELAALVPDLFARALRMAGAPERAEDLVQDSVERAIRFRRTYRPGSNLRAWVYQILFSALVTEHRRNRRERRALGILRMDPCAWTLPDPPVLCASLSASVARALENLPDTFREVVVLVDIEGRSYKCAAMRLGVPVGTIMSRLHRGRRALAAAIRALPVAADAA